MDFSFTDLFNLFDILKRASQHQPLTPSERAWAKAWGGVIDAVAIAAALFVVQFIATHGALGAVNWSLELASFGSVAYKAFKDARAKFFKAQAPAEVQTGNMLGSVSKGNANFQG